MSKRLIDLAFAGGLFAVSIWFWIIADGFPTSPRYAEIDTDFWPKITFACMAITTGLITLRTIFDLLRDGIHDASGTGTPVDWAAIARMVVMGGLVLAYFFAFGQVGFLLATVVFLWIAAFMLPGGNFWIKVAFAPVFTILLTLLFSQVLSLPLPRGVGPFYEFSVLFY